MIGYDICKYNGTKLEYHYDYYLGNELFTQTIAELGYQGKEEGKKP